MNTSLIDFAIYDSDNSIVLVDASSYNPDVTITESIVCVVPPNFTNSTVINYTPNLLVNINAVTLGWVNTICEFTLADGVYEITMSICPNDKVFKKKNYLRIYNLRKQIYTLAEEAISIKDINRSCELLNLLQNLEVAQWFVQQCDSDSYEKGVIIYNSVIRELTKYGCISCN